MTYEAPGVVAEIRALRAKGHSISEICEAVGRGRATVHAHCRDVPMPFGPRKSGPKRKVASVICYRLREQGLSYRAIAARMGVAVSAVHRAVNS